LKNIVPDFFGSEEVGALVQTRLLQLTPSARPWPARPGSERTGAEKL
jgi:hypothetical protein